MQINLGSKTISGISHSKRLISLKNYSFFNSVRSLRLKITKKQQGNNENGK